MLNRMVVINIKFLMVIYLFKFWGWKIGNGLVVFDTVNGKNRKILQNCKFLQVANLKRHRLPCPHQPLP